MNNNWKRNIFIWIAVFFGIYIISSVINEYTPVDNKEKIVFSAFVSKIENKEVQKIKIQGRNIEGILNDGTKFTTYTDLLTIALIDKMLSSGAEVDVVPMDNKTNTFVGVLLSCIPTILFIIVWVYIMKQMQGGGKGGAFGFGKSKAKLVSDKSGKITFADVAGVDEAKAEMNEIVEFLKDPGKFQKLGGKIPKGCLLIGSPGTGKTLLAKAIAGEASVPFFNISGSDFVEMFVGVGASRVRDMFEQGKKNAPCIIFIDEIDAVGRHRGVGFGGGNDEREQTLNQILVEMDGFDTNEGVIIIAATNRPEVLDAALLRPGRFDRQITISNPDIKGREQILNVHLKKIKHTDEIDAKIIARGTPGFSGAELANLVNESALLAARKNKKLVDSDDLEEAKDKVIMGIERRSMVMTDDEKKLTAYHEAGHAIVAVYSPISDPIHKATIIPRGPALGMVVRLPENDEILNPKDKIEANIAIAMGGRVAEELIFGKEKITSGAGSDIRSATHYATMMVKEFGMSESLGTVYYGSNNSHSNSSKQHSDETTKLIDDEIKSFIDKGYKTAKKILTSNLDQLHLLASTLLEKETLTGEEVKRLLKIDSTKAKKVK